MRSNLKSMTRYTGIRITIKQYEVNYVFDVKDFKDEEFIPPRLMHLRSSPTVAFARRLTGLVRNSSISNTSHVALFSKRSGLYDVLGSNRWLNYSRFHTP